MDIQPESSRSITTTSPATISHLDSSNDGIQGVDVSALVMTLPSNGLSTTMTTKEELIAQRISKRTAKKAEIRERADSHKRAGDLLYEAKNYKAAHSRYLEAIQLLGNVPEYYISLASAYRRLTWYEEAAHAATRALTIHPQNLEARYIRGVARLEQRLLQAAQTDFETVLEHDPTHLRALAAIAEVRQFLSQEGLADIKEENAVVDFGFPHWDYEALEVASVSDSSDCQHVGNGVPCRFYNHDGCGKGTACPYSHAPDEKSVRDDLGKNVCIYHILDSCKFGASRCVYSHSKEALPKRGWWNSSEKVAKVKDVLEVAEKNAKEQRQTELDKWKTYLKETRSEARARQTSEKQKEKVMNQAEQAPTDSEKKEAEQAKEEIGMVEEVEHEVKNAGGMTTATISKKAKAKRSGRKKATESHVPQQEKVDGPNGDASTTSATPAKRRTQKYHGSKNPKAGTVPNGHPGVAITR